MIASSKTVLVMMQDDSCAGKVRIRERRPREVCGKDSRFLCIRQKVVAHELARVCLTSIRRHTRAAFSSPVAGT